MKKVNYTKKLNLFYLLESMVNHLLKLLELYPNKPWNWYWLSSNPNITWDIVKQNPHKMWYWNGLSQNPNITCDIVHKNPDKPWNWEYLNYNTFNLNTFNYQKKPKLPKVSPQQKALILDLEQNWFGIPPNVNKKPVFVRGGPWCHELYNSCQN